MGVGVAGLVWYSEGYRGSEEVIWGLCGGAVVLAVVVWALSLVSVSSRLRVCDRCGASAPVSVTTPQKCAKCGTSLAWWSTRPIPVPRESPIPALRKMARKSNGWMALVPVAVVFLVLLRWPVFLPLFIIGAVFAATPILVLMNWRKFKDLRAKLESSGGRLCTVCLYPRNDGADRCPECGLFETERDVRAMWERSGMWGGNEVTPRGEPAIDLPPIP